MPYLISDERIPDGFPPDFEWKRAVKSNSENMLKLSWTTIDLQQRLFSVLGKCNYYIITYKTHRVPTWERVFGMVEARNPYGLSILIRYCSKYWKSSDRYNKGEIRLFESIEIVLLYYYFIIDKTRKILWRTKLYIFAENVGWRIVYILKLYVYFH